MEPPGHTVERSANSRTTDNFDFFDQFSSHEFPDFEPISDESTKNPPGEPPGSRVSRYRLRLIRDAVAHSGPRANTWGYTIYRTVYTPESDIQFAKTIERINKYIKCQTTGQDEQFLDTKPEDELWRRWQIDVIEDKALLEGADVERIGQIFDQRVDEHVGVPYRGHDSRQKICIMIDQEVLEQVLLLPEDPQTKDSEKFFRYVKIVTCLQRSTGGRYWFRCGVCHLDDVWLQLTLLWDVQRFGRLDTDGVYKWVGLAPGFITYGANGRRLERYSTR